MNDDLTAAVARLKAARDLVRRFAPHMQRIVISDHIDAAISALEAAQADAARARECDLTLSRVLHELAGHASLCWNPTPAGVFDTGEALVAVESAINELRGILRGSATTVQHALLDHQNGVQRDVASPGCALSASSLESGNAREATCLSGGNDARHRPPTQQGQLGANAGSIPATPTDPIADLCARLRECDTGCICIGPCAHAALLEDAADALERLAREREA